MKLRIKTLMMLAVVFTVLFIILTTVTQSLILTSFQELEDQSVERNIQRAVSMFYHEFDSLRKLSYDWSAWNDTYTFVEDRNQVYINANLQDVAFQGIGINVMMFYNTSSDLVFGKTFDPQNENDSSIPQALLLELAETEHVTILHHNSTTSYFQGIVLIPNNILLIASRPILTSIEEGPIHGTLIMGQFLNEDRIAEISDLIGLTFTIVRLDSIIPKDYEIARQNLIENKTMFFRPLNDTTIAGYSLINDIHNNPACIIRIEQVREIYQQGVISVWNLIIFLIIIIIIIFIAVIILSEKFIVAPLKKFTKDILEISTTKDLSNRITLHGNDEFTTLIKKTNTLLDILEKSQQNLQGKINELEHYKRSTIDRELKMIDMKKKLKELSSKQNGGPL
jgi:sensor domain CHASE-containing protein